MPTTEALRGIYLNDHLAGATAGLEFFRRAAGNFRGKPAGPELERLTAEVAADRESLLEVLATLGVEVRRYKVVGGWAVEKVGRLKSNGHLFRRSPLSDLVELEGLTLGVVGKGAGWRTLRTWAADEPRLDAGRLDELIARADRQRESLEALRLQAAQRVRGA